MSLEEKTQTLIVDARKPIKLIPLQNPNVHLTIFDHDLHVTNNRTLDCIKSFEKLTPQVVFVCEINNGLTLLGQSRGVVSVISLADLTLLNNFDLPLQFKENVTAGHFDITNDIITVGTSSGAILFGNYCDGNLNMSRIQVIETSISSIEK